MKEDNMVGGVGVTAFELPNNQTPFPHFKAHYGHTHVPHPTNEAAKVVHEREIMRQVMDAK